MKSGIILTTSYAGGVENPQQYSRPNNSLTFYGKWGGPSEKSSRLRYNRGVCLAYTYVHLPPVRCMMGQGSCAVSGVITVTNNYCCSALSALYASNIRVTKKPLLPVSTCTLYITDYMLRQFLLSALASALMHELSHAVLARGTFESSAVTYYCSYVQQ